MALTKVPTTMADIPTSATAQATTSGTSIDFTSIPAGVKRITVMFNGVSTNGTSIPLVQIGSGSVTSTGYNCYANTIGASSVSSTGYTAGFAVRSANATATLSGAIRISLLGSNVYVAEGLVADPTNSVTHTLAGSVTLSGAVDRVRITTSNGTDAFDAGSVNIMYE